MMTGYLTSLAEVEYYDQVASSVDDAFDAEVRKAQLIAAGFANPVEPWLDAPYDSTAQADAYCHIAPIAGRRMLQVGGTGYHALKFIVGGAGHVVLVTPVPGEAAATMRAAKRFGVADRLSVVVGLGEKLPLKSAHFWAIYSGGCVHHMVTELALAEAARVLQLGGRFSATEPWRAPLYRLGILIFGKREREINCRPLTTERVAPLFENFSESYVLHHGALSRYFLLALGKLGWRPALSRLHRIIAADDRASARWARLRRTGSSVALLGTKTKTM
jgi:ubiquinone/menaquinone biosynthesis C-methylase UbiE